MDLVAIWLFLYGQLWTGESGHRNKQGLAEDPK
jgi:hypothetical protein